MRWGLFATPGASTGVAAADLSRATMETFVPHTANGSADRALTALVTTLDECVSELERSRDRARALLDQRRSGATWEAIVSAEDRPLVVESISTVLGSLATTGSTWRREQAAALQGENVSINRIAAMFGVTRQRISALLREREDEARLSSD